MPVTNDTDPLELAKKDVPQKKSVEKNSHTGRDPEEFCLSVGKSLPHI